MNPITIMRSFLFGPYVKVFAVIQCKHGIIFVGFNFIYYFCIVMMITNCFIEVVFKRLVVVIAGIVVRFDHI